ncbi:MAG: Smr/MutS family protein [Deltaproteobacteria bacterium]|nr:Smr/MutS family protein [Deltaproteobacteria bacterium]
MSFTVAPETLESLEWRRLLARLARHCRTPQGLARVEGTAGHPLFEAERSEVGTRLLETTEARALLDRDELPGLAGCVDVGPLLARAEKGGILEPAELVDVRGTLKATLAAARFFETRRERCPALSALAAPIATSPALVARLSRCFDEGGELRDEASATLAAARRDQARLAGELAQRVERELRDPELAPHLSDAYSTIRNGRFVLPVRADARGHVRGIVHDASRSGTTLFIEPQAIVELNNRHREAQLAVERETLRVLRELSSAVASEGVAIRGDLECVGRLDLGFARGALSREMDASPPRVGREGILELPGLRHPLIAPAQCVANDLRVGADFAVLILSGPNAGGKTVAMKAMALAALMTRAGLHVPADPGARVDLFDAVVAEVGDHQDMAASLSTFSAAMAHLALVLDSAGPHTLVCLDEIGVGTDPAEGASIAQAALEALAEAGARVVTTTHYNLLKEMAQLDPRFANASVEFDPETYAPTYHVRIGSPGASSASTVAARMGIPAPVLERAEALLDREDRSLERMLSELAAARATLDAELTAARAARIAGEALRADYSAKLARLERRREQIFGEMRGTLDSAFREARGAVAQVVAALQRDPSSQRAAEAREALERLHAEAARLEQEHGIEATGSGERETTNAPLASIDWSHARPGDAVRTRHGALGTLVSLPDRHGRVTIQTAGAKLTLPREQLGQAGHDGSREARGLEHAPARRDPAPPIRAGGVAEIDLRGLRVEEGLERLEAALDQAAVEGRDEVRVIHGIGTGAMRRAVREHLPRSSFVVEMLEAAREDGGAGATRAVLRKD